MSVRTDAAALYAETFLTVPVLFGRAQARGFFDDQATVQTDANGMGVQARSRTLTLLATAFSPMPKDGDVLYLGAEGDARATTSSPRYRVRYRDPIGDGVEVTLTLTRA